MMPKPAPYTFSLSLLLFCCISFFASCTPTPEKLNGYVEGEYLYISPTTSGILETLSVQRGDTVKAGQILYKIDTTDVQANIATADAEVKEAQAEFNNLTKGKRAEEIEVILKQQEQAKIALENAHKAYERDTHLVAIDAISREDFEDSTAAFEAAQAREKELSANLKVAALGARVDEIRAAKLRIDIAQQKKVRALNDLEDAMPRAPKNGSIEDIFLRPGEYVSAGKPVLSLLPPENIKIRFFVSQALLPQLKLGAAIQVHCDGCKNPISAKISYISAQAEYTSPLIYSVESRNKLVFMIEAIPHPGNTSLRPGLPVDIQLLSP